MGMNHLMDLLDKPLSRMVSREVERQENTLCLIASENYASPLVRFLQGSLFTNKYAEGYPGRRYYSGCEVVDGIEQLAIDRAKNLFGVAYANVQSHSGSQANQATFLALLNPGDTILSLSLDSGGHLTHGSKVNQSGKFYNIVSYGLTEEGLINYEDLEQKAKQHKPKLIIAGFSSYSREIDFTAFREVADQAGAYLMVDMAHIAGMVAAGLYPEIASTADVITSTTHKTLRGPRGGMILCQDATIARKIDKAVFPGVQGGPLMHVIAAKAVAFQEAAIPEFKEYISQVLTNAKLMANTMADKGYKIVSGSTDNHLLMVDYRHKNGVTGHDVSNALERCGIVCNKNVVPGDPLTPQVTSGIRLGTPAVTTRGIQQEDIRKISHIIADVSDAILDEERLEKVIKSSKEVVTAICKKHPLKGRFL